MSLLEAWAAASIRPQTFLDGAVVLYGGDCLEVLDRLESNSIDAVCVDPPYHLTSIVQRFGGENAAPAQVGQTGVYARSSTGFMGKQWDGGDIAFQVDTWARVLRVLKPGGHIVAFGGTRSSHRMVCAIEDAGFEIRDMIAWVYGTGFPKSHDVSKGIDKAAGAEREVIGNYLHPDGKERPNSFRTTGAVYGQHGGPLQTPITAPATEAARQWDGWGTALKPAIEPICLARKPLSEKTVAANVLRWGTGALNIGACRIETDENLNGGAYASSGNREALDGDDREGAARGMFQPGKTAENGFKQPPGRWPANLAHDGSDEVLAAFPDTGISSGGKGPASQRTALAGHVYGEYSGKTLGANAGGLGDSGSAARFFYSAKASKVDRAGSKHPTVKPIKLMQWLVRLVTPPGGVVLDCFAGSGTTGQAAHAEGVRAVLIERETEYQADIAKRMRRMGGVLATPEPAAAPPPPDGVTWGQSFEEAVATAFSSARPGGRST